MKYCLIGKRLSHSYSEVLHKSYGLNYGLVELAPADLPSFAAREDIDGFNVTIPYKKDIMRYLDEISPLAERIGAVNTVVRKDGRLFGYNTDYCGFIGALKSGGARVEGRNVLVLGSGGASSTARVALSDLGAKSVTVVSRNGEVDYKNCYDLQKTQIVVNATPVGTFPEVSVKPVDIGRFPKLEFVFDLIYNPNKTALLKRAERLKIPFSNGLTMLVVQALSAREIWTGQSFSDEDVNNCLSLLKKKSVNIAIIGMPSSGKSTIGRIVAEKLGKEFFDTDEEILKETGRTPERIIVEDGESAFRDIEEKIVEKVCKKRGAIVSLGGGAVLREKNVEFLKATAFIVWLRRDLSLLTETSRPTLKSEGAAKMFERRAPLYKAACDEIVINDKTAEKVAEEVIKVYENSCDQRP